MKNKTALKVAFWGNAVLVIWMFLVGVPLTNIAAFILFMGLVGRGLFYGKNYKVAAIIVAGLMALLNLTIPSTIDVVIWTISLVLVIL